MAGEKGKREKRGSGPVRLLPLCSFITLSCPRGLRRAKTELSPIYPFTRFPLLPFSLSSRRVRLYVRLLHCRLGCRQTGNGHTIRRATDIVQLSLGAHLDGRGVAAVLAADADL